MTNPLLQKYDELYGKKEPPKMPRIEDCESEETIADELKKSKSKLKTYDPDSVNDSFLQIVEKVKNGIAQVTSVSVQVDAIGCFSYGKRITFEVYDYEL
jgi:hypothetical protein